MESNIEMQSFETPEFKKIVKEIEMGKMYPDLLKAKKVREKWFLTEIFKRVLNVCHSDRQSFSLDPVGQAGIVMGSLKVPLKYSYSLALV